jgi:hypothetical protein
MKERGSGPDAGWRSRGSQPRRNPWKYPKWKWSPKQRCGPASNGPPDGNKPLPAIRAAITHQNHLISSIIFRFAVAHCFDADYSDRFRRGANDTTACPCNLTHPLPPHGTPRHHTRHHIIFYCPLTATAHAHHLQGFSSLTTIFQMEEATAALCCFLEESNSSLLCPLLVLRLGHNPHELESRS